VVEAEFHLFQKQKKVTSIDTVVAAELCFLEALEVLDAVDVLAPHPNKFDLMVDAVMLVVVGDETMVAAKGIGVDDRA
jgi:hypothetical protein